jgi:hypothetical protein
MLTLTTIRKTKLNTGGKIFLHKQSFHLFLGACSRYGKKYSYILLKNEKRNIMW